MNRLLPGSFSAAEVVALAWVISVFTWLPLGSKTIDYLTLAMVTSQNLLSL